MESARARLLTTRAVGVCLLASALAFLIGLGLTARTAVPADAALLGWSQLLGGLRGADPRAFFSLGALGLILSPSVRLLGMALTFHVEEDPKARTSALVVLLLLLACLIGAPALQ